MNFAYEFNTIQALRSIQRAEILIGMDSHDNIALRYKIISILINLIVVIYFPITLVINLCQMDSKETVIGNLRFTIADVVTCLKVINTFDKRRGLRYIQDLIVKLDKRVTHRDEQLYLNKIMKAAYKFYLMLLIFYVVVIPISVLPVFFSGGRYLPYSAWFPFDWENSDGAYYTFLGFQLIVASTQTYQTLLNDSYPGIHLLILKGHVRALGLRVARIGYDILNSNEENYKKLVECISDHNKILEYFDIIASSISTIMFIQFFATELTLCTTAVYMLSINGDLLEVFWLLVFFTVIVLQISLCCYCANELIQESHNLTMAVYSCNWMDQDLRFKKTLIIFMQRSQKPLMIMAGRLVPVSLSTVLSVLQSAYSLFAVLNQMQ